MIHLIASGSTGNAAVIGGEILVDCGIPLKQIRRALPSGSLSGLKGCLLTHAHGDHAGHVEEVIAARVPVYAEMETIEVLGLSGRLVHHVTPSVHLHVGEWTVTPFPAVHDLPCIGYVLERGEERIVWATDTAYLRHLIPGVTRWALECNYLDRAALCPEQADRIMLTHMGLPQTLATLRANDLRRCREIVLLHVSERHGDAEEMVAQVTLATGIYTRALGCDPLTSAALDSATRGE